LAKLAELPASQRFFTGGDRSVRGYRYASLGPADENGRVVGGKHLLTGSIEYEFPFASAGIGLHWFLPVGTLRLDLASAFLDPDRPWRIHLSIGPDM